MKLTTGMIFVGLMLSFTAQGASFDCSKATTNLEKQICNNPAISKLDEKIGKLYQEVLYKADEEQKQRLVAEQKHWLKHTRNTCKDEPCIKLAYWARQAELATFFYPKPPLYKHESEKANAIKQALATAQLNPAEYIRDKRFCGKLFDDLKQMKDIRFVDPVVQAQSYEDPALDKWKRNCGGKPPLHFSYWCFRSGLQNVYDSIHSYADALDAPGCSKGFGTPPFKIFELPAKKTNSQKRYFIAPSSSYGSDVWEDSDVFPPGYWERVKPRVGGGAGIGTQQFDPKKCEHMGASFTGVPEGIVGNYDNIIEYKDKYYFMGLYQAHMVASDGNFSQSVLNVETVAPNGSRGKQSCSWSSIPKPDSPTQGSK